jgi:hypothetical protein
LNEKSWKSSSPFLPAPPFRLTTPFSPTFAFLEASAVETFVISGKDSVLEFFAIDF